MYYFPYSDDLQYYRTMQTGTGTTFARLFHAAPGTGTVDVYLDGNLISGSLRYRGFTPYLKVTQGTHNVNVYAAGTTVNPIVSATISLSPNSVYTLAVIGRSPSIELFTIGEPKIGVSKNRANIRFIHLSPGSPSVDVTHQDGKILFSNISYKGITNYVQLRPGRHNFELKLTGTNNTVLTVPNIILRPGKNYTLYAVGLAEGKPGLQLLIPLDGSTYL